MHVHALATRCGVGTELVLHACACQKIPPGMQVKHLGSNSNLLHGFVHRFGMHMHAFCGMHVHTRRKCEGYAEVVIFLEKFGTSFLYRKFLFLGMQVHSLSFNTAGMQISCSVCTCIPCHSIRRVCICMQAGTAGVPARVLYAYAFWLRKQMHAYAYLKVPVLVT